MKVLIISSNTLPAAPTGPVYLAGAVREAGHEVQIFERLFANAPGDELTSLLHPRLRATAIKRGPRTGSVSVNRAISRIISRCAGSCQL